MNNPERDVLRLSKRGLLRLSKKDLGEGPMVYDPERKRGLLRLSKRDGARNRAARDTILQLPQLLHLQQRSLRLSKRADNDSLRLSRRSDTSQSQDHKMVIRLSKRQLVNLVSLKRTLSSIIKYWFVGQNINSNIFRPWFEIVKVRAQLSRIKQIPEYWYIVLVLVNTTEKNDGSSFIDLY